MIDHEQAFYDTYSFFFDLPFGLKKKHKLFHGLIAGEPWAWRVVGITENALIALAQNKFEYKPRLVCRAHFVERMETSRNFFNKKIPKENFFKSFFKSDMTALALWSENKACGPSKYIPIDPALELFTSTNAGFKYGPRERHYLRDLYAKYQSGKFPLIQRETKVSEQSEAVFGKRVFVGTIGKARYLFDAENGGSVMELKPGSDIVAQAASINSTIISRKHASKHAVRLLLKKWREVRSTIR